MSLISLLTVLSTGQAYTLDELTHLSGERSRVKAWKLIQALKEQDYKINVVTSAFDPEYRYQIISENKPMENENKYDLVPDNYPALQGLLVTRAKEIQKDQDLTFGRAQHVAADEIAASLIHPPVSGVDLERWMGAQRYRARYRVQNRPAPEKLTLKAEKEIKLEATREDRPNPGSDYMSEQLAQVLKPVKVGETWSIPVDTKEQAEAVRVCLTWVSGHLGWRVTGQTKPSYRAKVLPNGRGYKLRVHRLT